MTAKEYLQKKHEWHRKHWNEHEVIDDNWWANEMEAYHKAELETKLSTYLGWLQGMCEDDIYDMIYRDIQELKKQ